VDPDDELITNVAVTAANTTDREVIDELVGQPRSAKPAAATEPAADKPAAGCAFLGEHDMTNRRKALYALPRAPEDVPEVR